MQVCHSCVAKAMTGSAAITAAIPAPTSARGEDMAIRRSTIGLAMIAESAARPKRSPITRGVARR